MGCKAVESRYDGCIIDSECLWRHFIEEWLLGDFVAGKNTSCPTYRLDLSCRDERLVVAAQQGGSAAAQHVHVVEHAGSRIVAVVHSVEAEW